MSSMELPSKSRDRSLKRLVSDLKDNTGLLVKQEIALAKAQVMGKAVKFGAAALLGYAGVLVLIAALVLGVIALGVAAWVATLIVAVVVLLGAFGIVQRARKS